jgi:hypothetical protein
MEAKAKILTKQMKPMMRKTVRANLRTNPDAACPHCRARLQHAVTD